MIPTERLLRLRRLGGLDGHPDVGVPGIEANSGSLGMGISKARGIAWAKRHLGRGGRVVVMTGDGELQEGQNWEALQAAAHQRVGRLLVIVDRNELQSDKATEEILAIESLETKLRAFGCRVETRDGHDHAALRDAFRALEAGDDGTPGVLVARTIKGKGVSFMEHPAALAAGGGTYRWHAGAPDDEAFEAAAAELRGRIDERLAALGLEAVEMEAVPDLHDEARTSLQGEPESGAGAPAPKPILKTSAEFVAAAYGDTLLELAAREPRLVVLDADLASDCRVRAFELAEPERFVENGIAEQDMVSMAAGMARHGLIPVVNSFASFLASRANEQIYNQASERTKVVYAMHYAGLIPAGPGKSHQSLRDASLMAAIPGVAVVHPCNGEETRALLEWAVLEATESVAVRLAIGPSPRTIELPDDYRVAPGVGVTLREGADGLIVSYGPVMLHEALTAAELLAQGGVDVGVVGDALARPGRSRLARRRRSRALATSSSWRTTRPSAPSGHAAARALGAPGPAPAGRRRRRGLARVRHAGRGARAPRARRRLARRARRALAAARHGVSALRDDEIVFTANSRLRDSGSEAVCGGRAASAVPCPGATWAEAEARWGGRRERAIGVARPRRPALDARSRREPRDRRPRGAARRAAPARAPARRGGGGNLEAAAPGGRAAGLAAPDVAPAESPGRARPAPRRRLARPADRLLPARDPAQLPPRPPSPADAPGASQRAPRLVPRRPAPAPPADRPGDGPVALLDPPLRALRAAGAPARRAPRARPLEPPDAVRPSRSSSPGGGSGCRSSATSRAGITPSARA